VNEEDSGSPVLINLSLALSEYTLSVSIFGRCAEVLNWLNRDQPFPPTESVADWVRDTAETIAPFGEGVDTALEYVNPESLNLYPRRKIALQSAVAHLDGEAVASGPVESQTITEDLSKSGLETRQALKVVSATCSNCGEDYLTCPCSFLGGNVTPPTVKLRFAFQYWAAGA
jgi:hypothetical protein